MEKVTISKSEYQGLVFRSEAYRQLASKFAASVVETPISDVVSNFKQTGKYSHTFLTDLKDGLNDLRKSKAWKSK